MSFTLYRRPRRKRQQPLIIKHCSFMIQPPLDKLNPTLKQSWKQREAVMKAFILIISLFAFPLAGQADWGWRHDKGYHGFHFWNHVDRRLGRQYHRIIKGVQYGYLTRREAKKLNREHRRLDRRIARIRHKHWLSDSDKRRIWSELDRAGDKIHRLKNNRRNARFTHRHTGFYR